MKKYITALAVILLLAGAALGKDKDAKAEAAKRQAAIQNTTIIAGQSIGALRIGMGMDEIQSMLGKPSGWKYSFQGGKSVSEASSWLYNDLNLEVFFNSSAVPRVTSINYTGWLHKRTKPGNFAWKDIDPVKVKFRTTDGIAIGSSAFDVQRAYSNYEWHGQGGEFMDYKSLGLFFGITSDHIVWSINVRQPQ